EPVAVDQVGGVGVGAAGVRVLLGEELVPAVGRRALDELIEPFGSPGVEGEVVQAGAGALVLGGGHVRRLLDDEVSHAQTPAAPTGPFLELLITKLAQQPAPLGGCAANVGNPQLDVMHGSNERPGHASSALRIGWGGPLRYRPLRSRGPTCARSLRRRPIVRFETARRRRPCSSIAISPLKTLRSLS